MKTELIPAVLYLRASSKKQDKSCEDQEKELRVWAKRNNYRIVGKFVDDGKSGSKDTKKRVAFHEMIAESYSKKWAAILVWNSSRFGRLNSIQSATYVKPLMENGCFLACMSDGNFDWRTVEGRMLWGMFCENNHRFSVSLASDVNRGRAGRLARGYWASGQIPFGYDRQYVDAAGNVQKVVRRFEVFQKPKNWFLTLVENKEDAEVIRLIFNRFISENTSFYELARKLNREGHPVPLLARTIGRAGHAWTEQMIRYTLRCPAYVGRSMLGTRSANSHQVHYRLEGVEQKDNACPALVSVEQWNEVQRLLKERTESRTKARPMGIGLLSGFLYCDHCGCRLQKSISNGRNVYSCMSGRRRPGADGERCAYYQVKETEVLGTVVDYLRTHVDRQLLEMAETKPAKKTAGQETILKAKVADLRRKVATAEENALLAPKERAASAWKRVEEWAAELREVENQLTAQGNPVDWSDWWANVRDNLLTLLPAEVHGQPINDITFARLSESEVIQSLPDGNHLVWEDVAEGQPTFKMPIVVSLKEPDKFRGLLRAIGLNVRFRWVRREGTVGKKLGQKRWELSETKISLTLKNAGNDRQAVDASQSTSPPRRKPPSGSAAATSNPATCRATRRSANSFNSSPAPTRANPAPTTSSRCACGRSGSCGDYAASARGSSAAS
ncbi:recombinase family protein [Limnoglobus roseus]|uniref:Recombinase family protein n=1 Tax=Limnoglobus roseus TaxID=2598579 RepID=A0A5C1AAW9_9BACT|nr:recombinase family protein [Limnoglobus roseus]QEL16529.1 recombinase family protein [Limnoglobus roseus]